MTTQFQAHFDGQVLRPDSPVELPTGCPLQIQVLATQLSDAKKGPLTRLAELAASFPEDPDWPVDGSAQHDHYLYGTPKEP